METLLKTHGPYYRREKIEEEAGHEAFCLIPMAYLEISHAVYRGRHRSSLFSLKDFVGRVERTFFRYYFSNPRKNT